MPERTDHNEAMRLIDLFELEPDPESLYSKAAAELKALLAANLHMKDLTDQALDDVRALTTERDQLRAEVERLMADGERLDWLESEADDLRTVTTGEDDYDWIVISHHMAKPHEREVGRANTARAAIDAARTTQKD